MAGILKRFAGAGADLLEEFYSKTPKQRLADASERATYDPQDGGLGLAPGNTSYERMQLMYPTRVFHGGAGTAAKNETITSPEFFASNHPGVAGTYSKGPIREANESDAPYIRDLMMERNQVVPDFNGNVMPLRLNDESAAVVDYEGRLFSGHPHGDQGLDILNDVMVKDVSGDDMVRIRREKGVFDDGTKDRVYLPGEETVDPLSRNPYSTNLLHSLSGTAMQQQYGKTPSMTRFDNIIDLGYSFRYRGEPSSLHSPQTVYSVRDGSSIRSEYAAFDPLLRKYSGLSLGASAAAVGSLLDQLPPGKSSEGALYER